MASFLGRLMTGVKSGLSAFRESYLSADVRDAALWDSVDGRQLRYALFKAFVATDSYRDHHSWSPAFKHEFGMYAFVRGLSGTAYELAEFWTTHLMGGALDPAAGDGETVPSALPIMIPESNQANAERLRVAIAAGWRDSMWASRKSIYTRTGAILGDVGLEVVDDPKRKKAYLRIVDPALIAGVDLDDWGNVKGYTRMEERDNPAGRGPKVTYTEIVERNGDAVEYRTYLNEAPCDWTGYGAFWTRPYGFVPMVLVQHLNVGLDWGWSELYAGLSKIREVDDLASTLDDQIRIMVNAPFLVTGAGASTGTPTATGTPSRDSQGRHNETRREQMNLFYGPLGATATPMILPLDVTAVDARITNLGNALEHQYPELQFERLRQSGAVSGIALRVARQPAQTKVNERRSGYDDGLVRAQMMKIAIAGQAGYTGYDGFGLDSYATGALDHSIGPRPVFASDPLDDLEEKQAFWNVVKAATDAGMPLVEALRDGGWDEVRITRLVAAKAEIERVAAAKAAMTPTVQPPAVMPVSAGG